MKMFGDHFLFLRQHNITPSMTYFNEYMDNRLRAIARNNNLTFYDKVLSPDVWSILMKLVI